jgi:hypothetical protein
MAWRVAKYVTRGVLDNRRKDLITGSIWFAGKSEPMKLELRGNFLRDMAGRLLTFENQTPITGDAINLDNFQVGMVGDMTASRKDSVVDLPDAELSKFMGTPDQLPYRKVNKLFIEWFGEASGRVVIEATDFLVELSIPSWTMTSDEEQNQLAANRESFRQWLEHLSELEADGDMPPRTNSRPMNEFEWEQVFKDSDRKNERLSEVLEKYHGHPDSEMLIAREMGWMWVEEELEAQERGVFAELEEDEFDDDDEGDDLFAEDNREPVAHREGIDWVRDEDGSIEHPLALRALRFSAALWKDFEESGMLGDSGDSRIFEWVGLIESAGVRLSNSLGELAYGDDVDKGFVIAGLKRSVHIIHQALDMLQVIEPLNLMTLEKGKQAQKTLFDMRQDILAMMKSYREKR